MTDKTHNQAEQNTNMLASQHLDKSGEHKSGHAGAGRAPSGTAGHIRATPGQAGTNRAAGSGLGWLGASRGAAGSGVPQAHHAHHEACRSDAFERLADQAVVEIGEQFKNASGQLRTYVQPAPDGEVSPGGGGEEALELPGQHSSAAVQIAAHRDRECEYHCRPDPVHHLQRALGFVPELAAEFVKVRRVQVSFQPKQISRVDNLVAKKRLAEFQFAYPSGQHARSEEHRERLSARDPSATYQTSQADQPGGHEQSGCEPLDEVTLLAYQFDIDRRAKSDSGDRAQERNAENGQADQQLTRGPAPHQQHRGDGQHAKCYRKHQRFADAGELQNVPRLDCLPAGRCVRPEVSKHGRASLSDDWSVLTCL